MDQLTRTKQKENDVTDDNNNVISLQAGKVSKEYKQACKLQNLGTRIPAYTLHRFRMFVLNKHGKINGPFSQEITKALEFWMDKQQQTTSYVISSSGRAGPRADVIEKYRLIAGQLKQLRSFPLVNLPTLKSVVKTILGKTDKRTFDKYLRAVSRLSKEQVTPFGIRPLYDVTRFVEKIQKADW